MAIKKTVVTSTGFDCPNAYHKVGNINISNKDTLKFDLLIFKEQGLNPFDQKSYECAYEIGGNNPIKQAYLYLKNLPEFEGAQDC